VSLGTRFIDIISDLGVELIVGSGYKNQLMRVRVAEEKGKTQTVPRFKLHIPLLDATESNKKLIVLLEEDVVMKKGCE
jgi:hypothetical protein